MNEKVTTEERLVIQKLIETFGESKVVKEFGVSTESLLRALADRPIRPGTVLMMKAGIEKMSKMKKPLVKGGE